MMHNIHCLENALAKVLGVENQRVKSIDIHVAVGEVPTATVEFLLLDPVTARTASVFEVYDLSPRLRGS